MLVLSVRGGLKAFSVCFSLSLSLSVCVPAAILHFKFWGNCFRTGRSFSVVCSRFEAVGVFSRVPLSQQC